MNTHQAHTQTLLLINKHMSNDCSSSNEIYEIRLMIRIDDWNCHALNKCRNCLLNIWFWNYHCVRACECLTCKFVAIIPLRPYRSLCTQCARSFVLLYGDASHHDRLHLCAISTHNFLQFEWFIGNIIVAISIRDVQTHFWTFSFLVCSVHSLVSAYLLHWYAQYHRASERKFIISTVNYTFVSEQRKRWVFTLKIECIWYVQLWCCWDLLRYDVKREKYTYI